MKIKPKVWISILVVVSVLIAGYASLKFSGKSERNRIAAEVNGEKILSGEVIDIYESEKANYGITEDLEKNPGFEDTIINLKSDILESLIYEKVVNQEAAKAGYTITNEILGQAKKDFDGLLKTIEEQMKSQETAVSDGSADYAKKAREYVDGQLKAIGKTQDEYIKVMATQKMLEKFKNDIAADVKITDTDIKNYYDSQINAQKEDPASLENAEIELYKMPEVRVKHILIELPEAQQDEIKKLLSEQKTEEAKKYMDDKLKEVYPKAQEVLNKAKKGEDFEKLIKEYGQDPGMVDNTEGYIVKQDGQFVPEFEEAAFKLKKDEISDIVSSTFGYHIIKAYDITPEKIFSFEEKKIELQELVIAIKKNEKWDSTVDEWMKKSTINRYENLV